MKKIECASRRKALCKPIVLAAVLGLSAFGAGLAHADEWDKIQSAKTLRVAIDLGVPPYGMKDANLKAIGSDVETAELLAKSLGLKLDIVQTTGTNRIPFLQTDKADVVISSLSVTPERAKVIDFTIPYAAIQSVIGAPQNMQIHGAADLAGKKVIATRGTTNDQELTKIAPPTAQIVRFDDDATSITALVSGQGDIFATAPALLKVINEKNPAKHMESKFTMKVNMLAFGIRQNEPQLKAKLDAFIKAHLKDGSLNAIYKKYHGADLPPEVTRLGE